jgi:peptidoglycan-associated lipoprotein
MPVILKSRVWFLSGVLALAAALSGCGGRSQPEAAPPPAAPADDEAERRRREAEEAERRAREEAIRREEEEAARRREAELARVRSVVAEMIFFDFDKSDIRPDARATLEAKAEVLRAHPEIRIRIEGHCDERGSDEYNLALGMRRALAARDYLVRLGLDPSRFEVVSFGEERPLDPRSNEEAWAKNRRAEFHITAPPEMRTNR